MNQQKTISFVVCGNGYGHFKRVLSVIQEFIQVSSGNVIINLFARGSLKKHYHNNIEATFTGFKNYTLNLWDTELMEDEFLLMNSSVYHYDSYERWGEALKNNIYLQQSDLIVSDNHVLPVMYYPDKTVLMGSFLWYDILNYGDDQSHVKKIVDLEKSIVEKYKPEILCVEYMAMPELLRSATPVFMPWFCNEVARFTDNDAQIDGNVLVTAGGTEANDNLFIELVKILETLPYVKKIWLDSKLFLKTEDFGFRKTNNFTFKKEDFLQLDAVFCRPGIGSLTDSVAYTIPVFAIGEVNNKEMMFNCDQVVKHGIGIGFKVSSAHEVGAQLTEYLNQEHLKVFRNNIKQLKKGGASAAADYLYSKIEAEAVDATDGMQQ